MRSFAYIVCLLSIHSLFAQLNFKSIPKVDLTTTQANQINADPATLPFWDDFSIANQTIDSLRIWGNDTTLQWEFSLSSDVFINSTLAINPPSYNVATFDGLTENGEFHSVSSGNDVGLADQLVSTDINLSSLTEGSNVYFSFYWQAGGNVEVPEVGDSLVLQFLNTDSAWVTTWMMEGGEGIDETIFTQEIIQLTNPFLHQDFRFRFQSYGDLDGPFDAWHVDWIYLNEGRTSVDNGYLDRAFTGDLTSPLFPFKAMPASQFASDNRFVRNQRIEVSNLDATDLYPIDVAYTLTNTNSSTTIISDADRAYAVLFPSERDTISLLDADLVPIDLADLDFSSISALDSVVLETEISLKSNDGVLDGTVIDLRVNDTIRQNYTLHNYYAYDDGTAEFAAGTNIKNGQVAVRFWVEETDTLTHIDFNFPNISPNQNGSTIILNIFDSLGDGGLLRSQQISVVNNLSRNSFSRYPLERPVIVSDTFYVSYQQSINDFLPIGFDRSNPDAAQHIFENIDGNWVQNVSLMGALMIRPVFESNVELVLSTPTIVNEIKVYPNPTNGRFQVDGMYQKIELLDLSGRVLAEQNQATFHDISKFKQGLYLLRIHRENIKQIKKIILK